jgi:16S rRNA (cytosine1402-N4)-methyltransferase
MFGHKGADLHQPVLLDETIEMLAPLADGVYVDATLGLAGHATAILDGAESTRVLGIDQDLEALETARKRLSKYGDRVVVKHANFSEIKSVAYDAGFERVDGIIADLGVSSLQFDSPTRGFSFRFDAPLDMRMDPSTDGPTAAELLASLDEDEIADLIYKLGEEKKSRRIARRIVDSRKSGDPIRTSGQLARLIEKAVGRSHADRIHPATRTFQALRIAVNRELEILEGFVEDSVDLLKTSGRLCVISFHSLEDRIVKRTFQRLSGKCFCPPRIPQCVCGAVKKVEIVTRKPVIPSEAETLSNPRSRSAKLRVCRKLGEGQSN